MKNIDIFPWNAKFNTNIPKIDEQHHKLVDLLNRLAGHLAFGENQLELETIFEELVAYADYHFETEEAIWHQHMPDSDSEAAHLKDHQNFIGAVGKLRANQTEKSYEEGMEEVLGFLVRWLATHILESDRHMALIVLALQQGMAFEAAAAHAKEQMSGSQRFMIDLILSIYETLSHNTLHLMRELALRKRLDSKIQKQDKHLKLMTEYAPAALAMTDSSMHYIITTQRWRSNFSLDEQDLAGRLFSETLPEIDTPWESLFQRAMSGEVIHINKSCCGLDGEQKRWVRLEIRPWLNTDETIGGVLLSAEDITQHIKSETKLKSQLAELQSWQSAMLDREDRMIELKSEVNALLVQMGKPPRYSGI